MHRLLRKRIKNLLSIECSPFIGYNECRNRRGGFPPLWFWVSPWAYCRLYRWLLLHLLRLQQSFRQSLVCLRAFSFSCSTCSPPSYGAIIPRIYVYVKIKKIILFKNVLFCIDKTEERRESSWREQADQRRKSIKRRLKDCVPSNVQNQKSAQFLGCARIRLILGAKGRTEWLFRIHIKVSLN